MRRWLVVTAGVLLVGSLARGQDDPNPQQLKRMYDDALVQLRAAQDRKNELVNENEKLLARLAGLQAKLDATAEQTYFLRSHYAAWQDFLHLYPQTKANWLVFVDQGFALDGNPMSDVIDLDWPWSAIK